MGNFQPAPSASTPARAGVSPAQGTIDIWGLLAGMWARKRAVLAIVGVSVALTAVALISATPKFAAETRLMIESRATAYTVADSQRLPPRADTLGIQSEVEVLTSRDLALRVIEALKLDGHRSFVPRPGLASRALMAVGLKSVPNRASREEQLTRQFARGLTAYPINGSRVIAISYVSEDGALASQIANRLAEEYIEADREAKLENTRGAIKWLDERIAALRKKVIASEAAVERFRASAGLLRGPSSTLNSQQLSELNSEITRVATKRAEAQARARAIRKILRRSGGLESAVALVNSPLVQRLADQKTVLRRRMADLSVTFLPSHPRVQRLNSEIASLNRQMRNEALKAVRSLEDKVRVAEAREASLRASLEKLKSEATVVNQDDVRLRALEREAKSDRESLESLLKGYRDATARAGLAAQPAGARIISHASAPSLPAFPKKGPTLVLAFVASTILALMYVFLREIYALNNAASGAPVLRDGGKATASARALWTGIRQRRNGERRAPAIAGKGASRPDLSELVTALDTALGENEVRRIAVSGMETLRDAPDLAVELARHFAALGRSTLLIDGDFHNAGIGEVVSSDVDGEGLAELLLGQASFGDIVVHDPKSRARLVASGQRLVEAVRLFDGERMNIVLDAYDQAYDLVILLIPDIVAFREASALAGRSDLVVLLGKDDGAVSQGWHDQAADAVAALNRPGQIAVNWNGGVITVNERRRAPV